MTALHTSARIGFMRAWQLMKAAVSAWIDDYAPSMGAALSYYTLFSLAPLLLIVIGVGGLFFGADAVRGELFSTLAELMGADGAKTVERLLASVAKPEEGVMATIVGLVVLVIGATTVFAELQSALDRIWRVPEAKKKSGVWSLVRARLLSFGMIMGIAFLLMVSLVMTALVAALGKWWSPVFGAWEATLQVVNFAVSFGMITVLFALIYKIIPTARIRWRDVWIGAAFTALLFTIGKSLIGLYIGKSAVASGFGAAGSLVVLMVWVYYSAQIFLIGAEFTWIYAHEHGSRREKPRSADVQKALVRAESDAGAEPVSQPRIIPERDDQPPSRSS